MDGSSYGLQVINPTKKEIQVSVLRGSVPGS